jgi:geranylgeranyl reductase
MNMDTFEAIVIGGGPAGATAATQLASQGKHVALIDKAGRIKPCGGAIPPRLIKDFDIPEKQIVAKNKNSTNDLTNSENSRYAYRKRFCWDG